MRATAENTVQLDSRSAENRLQFTSNAKNGLRLDLAPPEAGYASSLSSTFPHGRSEPSGLKFNWTAYFSISKSNRTQKVEGGCKRRQFSAETPSPTGGQKQRVANSCGFGVHPLLIPYDWRRSAQRDERADGFVAARALVAMLVVILWPAQLPCDAQRNYRYTYLV